MKLLLAASVVALAIMCPAAVRAANLPAEFSGVWVATAAANNQCRKADLKDEKNNAPVDRVMTVGSGTVNFYETRCKLTSVKPLRSANPNDKNQVNAEVDLTCSGEGARWQAREIWHVETVDGKKITVVTALRQTDYRDERGKKLSTPSLVTATVFFECK